MTQMVAGLIGTAIFFGTSLSGSLAAQTSGSQRGRATPRTVTPVSDCRPQPAELKALARQYRERFPDADEFIRQLDEAVRGDLPTLDTGRLIVTNSDAIHIAVMFPYAAYRVLLREALRKRESLDTVPVPSGIAVVVSPMQISAPDIIKVIVERDGRTMTPLENRLQPTPMTTPLGAKAIVHAGIVIYPCSAFAAGAGDVTVTAIPESGSNFVQAFASDTLAHCR